MRLSLTTWRKVPAVDTEPSNLRTLEPATEAAYSFKNLGLWQKAQDMSVAVAKLVDGMPRRRSADAIAMQLMRSASSIAANVAEGHGRFSFAAYKNHLSIAKGSATETQSWIDLAARLSYLSAEAAAELDRNISVLIAALTSRIRSLELQAQRAAHQPGSKVPRLQGSSPTPTSGGSK